MDELESGPLVAFIASQPGAAVRLRALHVDDGTGRCAVCSGRTGSARFRFPCTLRVAADVAYRLPTHPGCV